MHANKNLLIRKLNNKTKLDKRSETIGTYIRCYNPMIYGNTYNSKKKSNFLYRTMFSRHLHEKRLLNLGAGQ